MASGCRRGLRGCLTRVGKFGCSSGFWTDDFEEDILTFHSMISYPNYKFIFPIKALGMFARRFGEDADAKA
jgi:hypothetical protein